MNKKHTLIVGAGPAAIQTAVAVANTWKGDVSIANRNGSYSEKVHQTLERNGNTITALAREWPSLSGTVNISRFYRRLESVEDRFETIILCVPNYSYGEVIKSLNITNLKRVKTILLLSAGIGSNQLVSELVNLSSQRIEVISLSNYFAATKFSQGELFSAYTKAVKKRVYLASNIKGSDMTAIRQLLEGAGIDAVVKEKPINAECRNITTYVHPPFFINDFSLNEILSEKRSLKSLYKLYPEGPITPESIRTMVWLWKEISTLVEELGGEPINLLQFLNDDNYPVHEESISRSDIDHFPYFEPAEQEYLLYIRYASILIDPFSIPDENGSYFDFSKVPYPQISERESGEWVLPRIPFEDYQHLKSISRLGMEKGVHMPLTVELIHLFEEKVLEWQLEKGRGIKGLDLTETGERKVNT
ncbi:opine metallophore biosynthesis dehydrogenase [Guptibacillus algicola]|uniref:opine metallophore biosynthesis dehydrogenase n=1 Tax=Guptibacillus algicola TaxID=225844 RepID=UPI001CD7CB1E|nr:opine metallophore biosynthesis dehydrogenase [Alkalihalobacillus algicola]MCA0987360.1 opine metallophore biosynthesis dehydrogenase [Alkalihalobacillus algicola]